MGLFESEEEFAQVTLEEVFFEEGFFGSPVDKFAAFGIAVEVKGVEVEESVFGLDTEGDLEDFEGVVFVEAADAVETGAEGELVSGGSLFERGFLFSRFFFNGRSCYLSDSLRR